MSENTHSTTAWLGRTLGQGYLLLIVMVMGVTGIVALNEGMTRYMRPFIMQDATAYTQKAVIAVRSNPSAASIGEVSKEMQVMSSAVSVEHFANSRLMEQGIYYTTMPYANKVILAGHIFLGVFCLSLGGLQFWPQFRKRYMKAHRVIGALYVVTAPLSVVASMVYLALTPPHHIYDHLIAWLALWVFGILAIVSIGMAVAALKARRIHEHQAWMSLSFGCLIVAPMLRWNWLLLALAFPAIDQETLNLVTMGIMLPEVLLIGYGLSLVNRQYKRAMIQRQESVVAVRMRTLFLSAMPLWFGLALLSTAVSVAAYVLGDGLLGLEPADLLVPKALIEQEKAVFLAHGWLGNVFTLAGGLSLLLGLSLLRRLLADKSSSAVSHGMVVVFSTSTLVMAGSALMIGTGIGLAPSNLWLSGGTMYSVAGALIGAFTLFFTGAGLVNQRALMKESLVFILCMLPFPALFFATMWTLQWTPLPVDYIAAGQGYVLPAGFSMALFFVAMIHVVYGQATREHG